MILLVIYANLIYPQEVIQVLKVQGFLLWYFFSLLPGIHCLFVVNGQILEKTDYTLISGNPFIKKSGKRSLFFPH